MKASERYDESHGMSSNLKMKIKELDITTCNVILDFKEKIVEKASIDGTSIPRNWETIVEYYREHYSDLIEDLEKSNKPVLQ